MVKSSLARSSSEEHQPLYHYLWGQPHTITICGVNYQPLLNATEVAQWATLSCSRPSKPQTMASETVDPIDWQLHTTLFRAVPHEGLLHSTSVAPHMRVQKAESEPGTF